MGFRFRKSINLGGGVKVNLSKKGVGVSTGVKGLRVSHGADGKTRVTASLPGTGISYQETLIQTSPVKSPEKYVPRVGKTPKNLIGDEDRRGYNGGDAFFSCNGILEKYIYYGKRDNYYEKSTNIDFFRAALLECKDSEKFDHVVVEVTYTDPNTAAFSFSLHKDTEDVIKLTKIIENKGFFIFKHTLAKLRITIQEISWDINMGMRDLTFIFRDESEVDKTIFSLKNMGIVSH
jgi:hypothetical protein